MKTFSQFKKESLKRPGVKKAYGDLELEFKLIEAIIEKRIKKGLTQKQLAAKMRTKQSAIARFETGHANPTLSFIKKLADALNVKIEVELT